jgi:hypothetical protein
MGTRIKPGIRCSAERQFGRFTVLFAKMLIGLRAKIAANRTNPL